MFVEFKGNNVSFSSLVDGEPFLWGSELYMRMTAVTSDDGLLYNAVHFFSGMTVYVSDDTKVTPVNVKVVVERGNE